LSEWYQLVPGVDSLCLDLSEQQDCVRACEGVWALYNLAADMGGMRFIERFRIECLRSGLINTNLIEAANRAGAERYFYSSSACAHNTDLQKDPNDRSLKESDDYTAMAEGGMKTFSARFHNVYGPFGTRDGGREKAPAVMRAE
jgi:nucleoside-diphosphate-sugar epimerase